MEEYLRSTKDQLSRLRGDENIHIVLGNEACDLDSAVAALVYANHLHKTQDSGCLYIPVLNIPRQKYFLRTEITYFLGRCNISPDLLTFTDDLDLVSLAPNLQLSLVDHHMLTPEWSPLEPSVVSVTDHRPIDKTWGDGVRCNIHPVGSCCTLVAEEVHKGDNSSLDPITAKLLLGTILIDTVNLSKAAGKTTDRDVQAVEWLTHLVDTDTQSLYDDISRAKTDLSGLTCRELLEKDLKLVPGPSVSIAMSSVMMDAREMFAKVDMLTALREFCIDKDVAAVIIMTLSTPGGTPQRQLAVYSDNRIYRQQIADILENSVSPTLDLDLADIKLGDTVVYSQGNVTASRKKVMPIVKGFLNGEKTPDDGIVGLEVADSQEGALLDLSDSGKGESQGESDRVGQAEGPDVLSPDPFDHFDLGSPHSETNGSSDGMAVSPATNFDQFDPLDQQESDKPVGDNNLNANTFTDLLDMNRSNNGSTKDTTTNTGSLSADFIDNLVDVKPDDFEFAEADMLIPQGQDLLLHGAESPMEVCSGQNSGQGSKGSSYPVTPPNSFMDSNFAHLVKDHNLPSFNSSEMVERIWAKKALLGTSEECETEEDAIFTPQNSYTDSSMGKYIKETEIPSFHNTEMVQRIKEKRASLDNAAVSESDPVQDESEQTFPWTPHNSYVDHAMDRFGQENLPSFNNAEMVRRIHEKRESLPALDENKNEAGASGTETEQPSSVPYTPQNSCVDGEGEREGGTTDMTQVADRLVGANDIHGMDSGGNVVSDMIVQDMMGSGVGQNGTAGSQEVVGNVVAAGIVMDMMAEQGSNNIKPQTEGVDSSKQELSEDQLSETAMTEVAFTLANELIQAALNTFSQSEQEQSETETNTEFSEPSKPKSGHKLRSLSKTDANSISVETDYLPEMDPLRGNMDIVESKSLETDAVREVVESSSFRKISGQENLTWEERQRLLQEAGHRHGEAQTGRRHIELDPNISLPLVESSAELEDVPASPEQHTRKVIHVEQRDSFRFSLSSETDENLDSSGGSQSMAEMRHHYSNSSGDNKEVFMTSAGRISIGVDGERSSLIGDTSNSPKEGVRCVEVQEEWQDDGYPGMLREQGSGAARPQSLHTDPHLKKKIVPDVNLLSDEDVSEGDLLDDVDDLETPNDLDTPDDIMDSDPGELEWEIKRRPAADDTPITSPGDLQPEPIPEYTEQEEKEDARHWKTVVLGDRQFRIDLRVIEPYKKVLSHGGYYGDGLNAIILFSGCYLPDRRRKDYHYVMDNLFYYVVHTLEQLVAEDYMIVYFHGATPRRQMPGLSWLKKCYQMIDRRLRKNLKALLLVHPTLWLKTVVMMTRPFISAKFISKLRFVRTLQDLSQLVPMEHVYVPDQVKSYDSSLHNPASSPSSPHTLSSP